MVALLTKSIRVPESRALVLYTRLNVFRLTLSRRKSYSSSLNVITETVLPSGSAKRKRGSVENGKKRPQRKPCCTRRVICVLWSIPKSITGYGHLVNYLAPLHKKYRSLNISTYTSIKNTFTWHLVGLFYAAFWTFLATLCVLWFLSPFLGFPLPSMVLCVWSFV